MRILIFIGFSATLFAQDSSNLVEDPSFEKAALGGTLPLPWGQWKSDKSTYAASIESGGHSGARSIQVTGEGGETAINGKRYPVSSGDRYLLSGYARVEGDSNVRATVQFVYWAKDGQWLGNTTFGEALADSKDWRHLATVSELHKYPQVEGLSIALVFSGKGKGQFDDISLTKLPPGERDNLIPNGDLEAWSEDMLVSWFTNGPKDAPARLIRVSEKPREGSFCARLTGKGPWGSANSGIMPIDKAKAYRGTAHVKVLKGNAHLQIGYFEAGKWLGSSDSAGISNGDWTILSLEADLSKFKETTKINIAVIADGPEFDVLIDDVDLMEKPVK